MAGEGLPIFFWGQNYGFALVEVLFIMPFYLLLGYTTVAVKLAMLLLWSIGVIFLYKAMLAINKENRIFAFLLIVLFILSPTWSNWSMNARGGYLTSFTFTSITLFLLYTQAGINKLLKYAVIGVTVYIVYISQPFWLTGLLPLLLYKLVKEKSTPSIILFITAFSAAYFAIQIANTSSENIYAVHPDLSFRALVNNIPRFPGYLYRSLQGNYSFAWYQEATIFHRAYAWLFSFIIYILLVAALLHLLIRRDGFKLFITSVVFIPLVFLYCLSSEDVQGRYLLPVAGFTLLSLYIYYEKLRIEFFLKAVVVLLIILSGLSTLVFPRYFNGEGNMKELKATLAHLEKHDIKNLYATNTVLP